MNFTAFYLSGCVGSKDTVLIQATFIVSTMPINSPLGMDIANGVLKYDSDFERDNKQITHKVSANGYDNFYQKCMDIREKWLKTKVKVEEHLKMHKSLEV